MKFLPNSVQLAIALILLPVVAGGAYLWVLRGNAILLDLSLIASKFVCF